MLDLIYYPLGDLPMLVSNRYFYHTSIGIFLYLAVLIDQTIKSSSIKIVLAGAYFMLLTILFTLHLPVWKNQVTMYENNAKYYPSEETLYKLAMIYERSGNTGKAISYLNRADQLGTDIWINNTWPYYQERSRLYLKAGKYNKALTDINTALKKTYGKTRPDDSLLEIDKIKIETALEQSKKSP